MAQLRLISHAHRHAHTHTHAFATDRCGPDFVGSAYRFYGETCSRCALIVAKPKPEDNGLGPPKRHDPKCGADHYDQVKIVRGSEPKVAHVMPWAGAVYRHPLRKHDSDE